MRFLPSSMCLTILLCWIGSSTMSAAQTKTERSSHQVAIGINPITVMALSGDPMPLVVDRFELDGTSYAPESTTLYSLTTNVPNVALTAELDFDMPEGTRLVISTETTLGNSRGVQYLQRSGQESRLVSGIERGLENGRPITFRLEYDQGVSDIPFQSRSITFSLVNTAGERSNQVISTVFFGINTIPAR